MRCFRNLRSLYNGGFSDLALDAFGVYQYGSAEGRVGKCFEWTPSESNGYFEGLKPPHVIAVRSYSDFTQQKETLAISTAPPDCPDLNLQCSQRKKKRVGGKGGCGEKDRYDEG
ncbi:hypothetical protein R1sor_016633 [Riccia sorocarpa]|uniref:Uncharacterized protein n=1 Tax=Riccia sorocarpa TaxID=122646 RepID=A0ABD3HJL5_9MARC